MAAVHSSLIRIHSMVQSNPRAPGSGSSQLASKSAEKASRKSCRHAQYSNFPECSPGCIGQASTQPLVVRSQSPWLRVCFCQESNNPAWRAVSRVKLDTPPGRVVCYPPSCMCLSSRKELLPLVLFSWVVQNRAVTVDVDVWPLSFLGNLESVIDCSCCVGRWPFPLEYSLRHSQSI